MNITPLKLEIFLSYGILMSESLFLLRKCEQIDNERICTIHILNTCKKS